MSLHPYIYSLDEKITLSKLKKNDYDASAYDVSLLQSWMKEHDIYAHIVGEDAHFKFSKISTKPYIIYSRGNIDLLDQKMIAIVGPRKVSPYITRVMEDFFEILSQYDVVTISGGAPGVDTLCHQLSHTYSIPTVMVLGAGLGYMMKTNKRHELQEVVDKGGLILSEFKLKQDPTKRSFPQRNRIVAGLSESIFLPGAAEKSGSLITVDFGLQMHIPIGTVPASIYEPSSAGTNAYIAQHKIDAITDFDSFLGTHFHKKTDLSTGLDVQSLDLSPEQLAVVLYISEHGASSLEQMSIGMQTGVAELMGTVMDLEMEGLLKDVGGGKYGV